MGSIQLQNLNWLFKTNGIGIDKFGIGTKAYYKKILLGI